MSIAHQIQYIVSSATQPVSVIELYAQIAAQKHSIRARLHYATKAGRLLHVGKAMYIAPCHQVGMQGDSRTAVAELAAADARFDFVMLDLPWESKGTKGGNRHISRFATITPLEFDRMVMHIASMLRDDHSPVCFIFSNGATSAKAKAAYQAAIDRHLNVAASGDMIKTDKAGKRVAFMGRTIPTEGLWLYTRSGRLSVDEIDLTISTVRPPVATSWPTEKSVDFVGEVLQRSAASGVVLDPFGGSGSTAAACAMQGLSSLSIDIMHNPVAFRAARVS